MYEVYMKNEKNNKQKLSMINPDAAGIDILLVGDSFELSFI